MSATRVFLCSLIGVCLLGKPLLLHAQTAPVDPHPLIEQRVFNGVENVNAKDLGNTLSTQPTKCRAFFLKPLCSLTHNHLFETRNWLDRDQLRRDVLRIKVYYWLRGFRHAQVDTVVAEKGRGVSVTFNVREGPPTVITAVDLTQPLEKISDRRLRRMGLPQAGDRIDLTRMDSVRTKARRFLWDAGYGNAFVADSAHPLDSLHVHLAVSINSGPVTTIDTVVVKGNEKVTSRTVQRLIAMRRGDIFKRPQLLEGQRRLYRSDLFRMSLIEVPDSADSAKTVVVTVREAPMKGMQLGAGYNTVEFGQLQANLTLYNFKGSARRVDLHSAVGNLGASRTYCRRILCSVAEPGTTADDIDRSFLSPTWQLSASISQPWFFSTNNSIGMTAFSNRRVVPGIVIDRGNGVSATFTRTLKPSLPVSLSYRFERSRVDAGQLYFCVNFGYCMSSTIGDLQQWRNFSPFVLNVTADRTDDPLEPHTGYTGTIDVEHASPATGSDWAFTRYEAEFTPYFRIGKRTLVVHGHYGRVSGNELHPRTRFYAGGSRSVRGYAEGQLGPRVLTVDPNKLECTPASIADASCDPNPTPSVDFVPRPVGGNSLLEGTIEYRATLTRAIGGAVFVDYGRVTPNKDESARLSARSAITPGIGFRYSSPIGPVRVDLGLRPKRTEDLHVLTEVRDSASNLLRLVELNQTKAFDQVEGSRGFFGKAFSRMQLHIYIGEAY